MRRFAQCKQLGLLVSLATLAWTSGCESSDDPPADDATTEADTAEDTQGPVDTFVPPDEPKELTNGAMARAGHVVDGDTLDVLVGEYNPVTYSVRLLGINAPECSKRDAITADGVRNACVLSQGAKECDEWTNEHHSTASYEALKDLVEGKELRVSCDGVSAGAWCPTDPFNRHLVYLEVDGKDVSTELARGGHVWSFTAFPSSKRAQICQAEYDARAEGAGMWAAGSVSQVLSMMCPDTQNWYESYHDKDCDKALGL